MANAGYGQKKPDQALKVDSLMEELRGGKGIVVRDSVLARKGKNRESLEAVQKLKKYNKDASEQIQFAAQDLEYRIAKQSDDVTVKKEVVTILSQDLAGNNLKAQHARDLLLKFEKQHFSPAAKNEIAIQLKAENAPQPQVIRLAGVAGMEDQKNNFRNIIRNNNKADSLPETGKFYGKTSWASHLALARMGDANSLQYILARVKAEPDEVILVTLLLEDVAYTRQPQAVELIKQYLFSNDRLPPLHEGADGTLHAQYAAGLLAEILEGFPLTTRFGYTLEEIETARQWMRANTNYTIKK